MESRFNRRIQIAKTKLNRKPHLREQQIKEDILMQRLEETLGKPRREIRGMLSNNLISLLAKVPFSTGY